GSTPPDHRCSGRPGSHPRCEEYKRRCLAGRLRHDARNDSGPRLTPRRAKLQGLPDTVEGVAFGNAAGVSLIDGRAQRSKLRLVLPLLALQRPERGAHNLAGVFVTSVLNLLQHEAVKLFGQIDISRGHGDFFRFGATPRSSYHG